LSVRIAGGISIAIAPHPSPGALVKQGLPGLGDKLPQQANWIENPEARINPMELPGLIGRRTRKMQQIAVARHEVVGAPMHCQIQVRFVIGVTWESKTHRHWVNNSAHSLETIEENFNELRREDREFLLDFGSEEHVTKFRNHGSAEQQLQTIGFQRQKGKRRTARHCRLK